MGEPDVQAMEKELAELKERNEYLDGELKTAIEKRQSVKKERDEFETQMEEARKKQEEEKGKYKELYEEINPKYEEQKSALDEAKDKIAAYDKEKEEREAKRREDLISKLSDDKEKEFAEDMTNDQLEKYIDLRATDEKPNVDTSQARKRVLSEEKPKTLDEWRKLQTE